MICRMWHSWTTPDNADVYEALLKQEIFPSIQQRNIAGYNGIQLLRRDAGDKVEFITLMWFESLAAVRVFAGDDYEHGVVPPKAQAVLARFDTRSQHYEVEVDQFSQS